VELFLPRFKMDLEFGLKETLEKMGMRDAFTGAADFSGMDGQKYLLITAVLHKAWVEVNEEGTEAAAATAVVAAPMAARREQPPPPPVFRADHPFIFLIRDARSGAILFLGRLSEPIGMP
jgi:serpin B